MKTIGIFQLGQKKFNVMPFDGVWKSFIGEPEINFSAIVYGPSGNGKTSFCVKFAKYLTNFGKVLYLSHEEGISKTIQVAFNRENMHEVNGKIIIAEKATLPELIAYLSKRNSPSIVFLDSLDYMKLTVEQYKILRSKFPKKAFIIVSWGTFKKPNCKAGEDIEFMSDVKIIVKRYMAYCKSRLGGIVPYIIWAERAGKPIEQWSINDKPEPKADKQPNLFDNVPVN